MTHYEYLIIGGGAAGVNAAEAIREVDSEGTIGILSGEPHLFYSRVLLPHYLKKRTSREKVFLRDANDFNQKRIDFLMRAEVRTVDSSRREVLLKNRSIISFRKLLIASGGHVRPFGTEKDTPFLYRLQTLDDADRLAKDLPVIKKPLVIGSSFISLEFLEIFLIHQLHPTLLSSSPWMFSGMIEAAGAEVLERNFKKYGIETFFNETMVSAKAGDAGGLAAIKTQRGKDFSADALGVGIGIERNLGFLDGSAIALGTVGILTNEFLETSAEDIFAAGDVAEFMDVISGTRRIVGNWTNAMLQGRQAGLIMAGKREPFHAVSSYAITNLGFQLTFLGECDDTAEGVQTVMRVDQGRHWYERFFVRGGVLIGGAFINCFADRLPLTRLIEAHVPITEYLDALTTWEFDIATLKI